MIMQLHVVLPFWQRYVDMVSLVMEVVYLNLVVKVRI